MHTATNPGMNIEDELEAEIQRELDALEIDENEEENDADYPHIPEDKEEEDEVRGFNSLAPGRPRCHFKTAIFNLVLSIGIFTSSKDNALR